MNQFRTNRCERLTRQVQPMQHGVGRTMFEALQGPQAVALSQGFQDFNDPATVTPKCLKERALVRTKGVKAGRAIQALLDMAVNLDIACIYFGSVGTVGLIAPLPFEFHSG